MAKKNEQEETFLWDDPTDTVTFFGEEPVKKEKDEQDEDISEKEDGSEENEIGGSSEGRKDKSDSEEEEVEDTFFEDEEEEEGEDPKKPKPKSKPKPKTKTEEEEKNEDEDDEEPDPVAITDWAERMGIDSDNIEESFEDILEQKLTETLEGFSEKTRQALLYEKNGGNIEDFFKKDSEAPVVIEITKDLDMEEEDNQHAVVVQAQMDKGDDRQTAEDYADYLKEANKLEAKAKVTFSKVLENRKSASAEKVRLQREARKAAEVKAKAYTTKLNGAFKTTKEIRFNTNDRLNLVSDMTKPTEDIGAGRLVPKLHKKIQEILTGDPDKALIFGKLVMSNVDLEKFKKSIVTGKVKKIKEAVDKRKPTSRNRRPDPLEGFLGSRRS